MAVGAQPTPQASTTRGMNCKPSAAHVARVCWWERLRASYSEAASCPSAATSPLPRPGRRRQAPRDARRPPKRQPVSSQGQMGSRLRAYHHLRGEAEVSRAFQLQYYAALLLGRGLPGRPGGGDGVATPSHKGQGMSWVPTGRRRRRWTMILKRGGGKLRPRASEVWSHAPAPGSWSRWR